MSTASQDLTRFRDFLRMHIPQMFGALVCSALAAGCGDAPAVSSDRISPVYNAMTSRLEVLKYDANGNGTFDTWSHMDGTKVQWIEIDRDEDGVMDRWEYYGPDQKLLKVTEHASKDAGVVDRTEFYEHDALARVEEDTDGDGKVDRWETYADGALSSAAYDTKHRGAPDRRLVYRADGTLDRIEADLEGTGTLTRVSPQP